MTRRTTMIDIAQKAGVSQATVSLVLNDVSNARVSQETRDRVRKIADAMGYSRRSAFARSEVRVIGLLIDEVTTTPFATPFFEGARSEAAAQGAVVAIFCTAGNPDMEAAAIDVLSRSNLHGVLYCTLVTRTVHPPTALGATQTVLLNCHDAGRRLPSVVPGDVNGGYAATETLIRAGHQRIAHISGETWGEAARDRALGYRRALGSHDIPFAPELLDGPAWTAVSGREVTRRLLDLPKPPTAFFCFNDRVALGCYEALAERGLHIPRDVSVIGFDNDELAANLAPPLTTLILPHEEMARWAVSELLARPPGSPAPSAPLRLKMDCDLIERSSVSAPPV